jgi:hypothetical protein
MIRKSLSSLAAAVAVSFGVTTFAPSSAVAVERPFRATCTGNAHLRPSDVPGVIINEETDGGEATHLGRFDWADVEHVDLISVPGGIAVSGTFTMTAADGDKLFGELTTIGFFDAEGNINIFGCYCFSGGTGRFQSARGRGFIEATAFNAEDLPFAGTFNGTIDY